MRRLLALLLSLLACGGCVPNITNTTVCRADIRLQLREGLLFADAVIDGLPEKALFDTGANISVVTAGLVIRRGIPFGLQQHWVATGASGAQQRVFDARLEHFVFAGYETGRQAFPVISTQGVLKDRAFAGLIGADLLSHFELDLDAAPARLTVYDPARCPQPVPAWSGKYLSLPLLNEPDNLLIVDVQVDGTPLRAMLDTGSDRSVLSLAAAERLGADPALLAEVRKLRQHRVPIGIALQKAARFRLLEIGGDQFESPPLAVGIVDPRGADLLLGLDWLRQRRVWISYRTRRLFIAQDAG